MREGLTLGDCIFCQIVAKQAPASFVYEDEHAIAFLDLFPMNPGHTLIIPKLHAVHIEELSPRLRSHLFEITAAVVKAQKAAGIPCDGNNIFINDGPAANQHVPHVHIHSLPRKDGDLLKTVYTFATRFKNYFGQAALRKKLDDQAAQIAAHMPEKVTSVMTESNN
ncbi:MAG: HIT family protein [Pseudomonadales bacterium]|nr:HIT family protein [Pseudomonadales bacterium]